MWWLFWKKKDDKTYVSISDSVDVKITENNFVFYRTDWTYLQRYFPNNVISIQKLRELFETVVNENWELYKKLKNWEETTEDLQKVIDLIRSKTKIPEDFMLSHVEDFRLDSDPYTLDFDNKSSQELLEDQYIKFALQAEIVVDKEWNQKLIPWSHFPLRLAWEPKDMYLDDWENVKVVLNKNCYFLVEFDFSSRTKDEEKFNFLWVYERIQGKIYSNEYSLRRVWKVSIVIDWEESLLWEDSNLNISESTREALYDIFMKKIVWYLKLLHNYNLSKKETIEKEEERRVEEESYKKLMTLLKVKPLDKELAKAVEKMKKLEDLYQEINRINEEIIEIRNS